MKERTIFLICTLMMVFALAGCAGTKVEDRIDQGMVDFDSWSLEVQEAVREGRIEVGFTKEQVEMAWGKPDFINQERLNGELAEHWVWEKNSMPISIGIGVGGWGRSGGVGGSVGTTVGGEHRVLKSVWFQDGVVDSYTE